MDKKVAILWSEEQKQFHIDDIDDSCRQAIDKFIKGNPDSYVTLGYGVNSQEADLIIKDLVRSRGLKFNETKVCYE